MSGLVQLSRVAKLSARVGWHGLSTDDHVDDGEYLVTGTDFIGGRIDWDSAKRVSIENWERDPNIHLENGDLLVTKDGTIGKVAVVDSLRGRATLNSGVFRVRCADQVFPRFLYWVLQSAVFEEFVGNLGSGSTINHLYQRDFEKFKFPLPELAEQRRIADYLDDYVLREESIVRLNRRQAALEAERVACIFAELVREYGGVFPSRVDADLAEWTLPAGWRAPRLSQVLRQLTNGYVGPTRDILVDEGVRYIQGLHIKNGRIDFARRPFFVTEAWHRDRPRIQLREGDVLVVQTGDIGQVAVVPAGFGEASCHALQILRVRPDVASGSYLGAFLRSPFGHHSLLSMATGALHPHLEGSIRAIRVLVPPLDVQGDIVRAVTAAQAESEVIRQARARRDAILAERTRAVISEAVAGRLDVATARRAA